MIEDVSFRVPPQPLSHIRGGGSVQCAHPYAWLKTANAVAINPDHLPLVYDTKQYQEFFILKLSQHALSMQFTLLRTYAPMMRQGSTSFRWLFYSVRNALRFRGQYITTAAAVWQWVCAAAYFLFCSACGACIVVIDAEYVCRLI